MTVHSHRKPQEDRPKAARYKAATSRDPGGFAEIVDALNKSCHTYVNVTYIDINGEKPIKRDR